jgi:RNA polymerase sigma-70 factor (ECF subfamily)
LVQRSLLKIHQHFGQLRQPQRPYFLKWVRQIVYHVVCDGFRRRGRQPIHLGSRIVALAANPGADDEQQAREEWSIRLSDLLGKLPERARQVIEWRFLEQLPDAEIARRLGTSNGAVRVLRFRAMKELRHLMEATDDRQR